MNSRRTEEWRKTQWELAATTEAMREMVSAIYQEYRLK